MKTRRSVTLTVLVDLKVDEKANIKNIIERLECRCSDMSGEAVEVTNVQVLDRNLLLEVDTED
jgi:hypothetical protein